MDERDRDKTLRRNTPPAGTPAREHHDRMRKLDADEHKRLTPVENELPLDTLSRGIRSTKETVDAVGRSIGDRVSHLEGRIGNIEGRMTAAETALRDMAGEVSAVNTKATAILEEANEQRADREERRKAREARLEREADRRHDRWKTIMISAGAIIASIGAVIAAVAGALK